MKVLKKVEKILEKDYNQYLVKAKSKNKKIIGYIGGYFPEEVIAAAGFEPFRLRALGSNSMTKSDIYYSKLNCTFVRHCFDKALRGDFDFTDGIIFGNECDHSRRMYDNWRHADFAPEFKYMFVTPHVNNNTAVGRFEDEINKLISAMNDFYGVKISDKSLKKAIELYNKKRSLIKSIYKKRKLKNVPFKGSELLSLMLAVTVIPVRDANRLLQEFLDESKGRVVNKKDDLRVYLAGGSMEEVEHLELIEDRGGVIVADNIDYGNRYADMQVNEKINPVRALAERYLTRISSPRMMDDYNRRLDVVKNFKKEYKIDAFIIEKLKFCDLWGGEIFIFRKEFKKMGYPLLSLERELYGGGEGQISTRLQAFFEQIRNNSFVDEGMLKSAGDNYRA